MQPIIKVENLGKKYLISHQAKQPYRTLRDEVSRSVKNMAKKVIHPLTKISNDTIEEFWALKDIDFEIQQGDRVGIIGRNGAGKSTLLKLLSRITEPTTGRITLRGRVASLLEVGTGFHPELTGRENIFLNGAILGMSKIEIKRKFDEIVAFAEVERFLDTPVKHYSSGMYVRLAFAVAAHLEPEILIVDEVLAVGDAQFQKKCLGKMSDISQQGRTVLFVSHNHKAIQTLCSKSILINKGRIDYFGKTKMVLDKYLSVFDNKGIVNIDNKYLHLESISAEYREIKYNQYKINIIVNFKTLRNIEKMYIDFGLENKSNIRLFQIVPEARNQEEISLVANFFFSYSIEVSSIKLAPNDYYCTIYAYSKIHGVYLLQSHIFLFSVIADDNNRECLSGGFTAILLPAYKTKVLLES